MNRPLCGIFVGGASRRMNGHPKGLLPCEPGGETIVGRLVRIVQALELPVVLVGQHEAYRPLGLPMLADQPPGVGPLGGLCALLRHAQGREVGLVRKVHQVVDHQAVVGLHVVQAAAIGPLRVVGPVQVGQLVLAGLGRVAGPDPDEAVLLDDGKAADRREATHALARHRDGLAVAAHLQAVVAANELALHHPAQRQRRAAVRAEVLQRRDPAVVAAVEDDALATDGAAQRLVVDLARRGGHVPGIADERGGCGVGHGGLLQRQLRPTHIQYTGA